MTATATEAPPRDPAADRREAEIHALEAAAVAAILASLARRLTLITGALRAAWNARDTDPIRWNTARQAAAGQLLDIRPAIGPALARFLPRAAKLGATHAGAPLPKGHDPAADDLVTQVLARVDADVTARLQQAASRVLTERVETATKLDDLVSVVEAPRREAEAQISQAVVRATTTGAVAAAQEQGITLVWVASRDACLSCLSMAGAVNTDGLFRPVREFAPRMIPWLADGVVGAPAHRFCRCTVRPDTPGVADGLRREAERSVARGWSAYDSLPARLKALDTVLRRSRLPRTVVARAAQDKARGAFTARHTPRLPYRSGKS